MSYRGWHGHAEGAEDFQALRRSSLSWHTEVVDRRWGLQLWHSNQTLSHSAARLLFAELLEILGSIINGFALPLNEEHKV